MKERLQRIKKHRYARPLLLIVGAILLPGPAIIPLIVYVVYRVRRSRSKS